MEVVKNNNTTEVTCQHCHSILKISWSDIRDTLSMGTIVKCDGCDKDTQVPLTLIPMQWRDHIGWADQ